MPRIGLGLRIGNNRGSQAGYTSSYTQALVAQATTDAVDLTTSGAYLAKLDTTLVALETAGILAKTDVAWFLASTGSALARYNIINPAAHYCTLIGTPTFTALKGFNSLANGSNILDTNWNPTADAVNMALNSASLVIWHYEAPVNSGSNQVAAGAGANLRLISIHSAGASTRYVVNAGSASSTSTLLSAELAHIDRKESGRQEIIMSGVEDTSSAIASSSMANQNLAICAQDTGGASPYNGNVSIVLAGASLYAERAQLNTILAAHMASL